jgi:hypothetical protein
MTIAFDPTELLGSRTWGDASTDTIVWTWNRATGTDPTMTFGNGFISHNGDLKILGDDLFMTTNTDKFLLVADGTNFNPVESTGDVIIDNTGAATIQADSVALTTDTTGNYAAGDAEAGAATSGDTATAFFGAGTIEHERGGIEADISAIADGGILVGTGAGTMGIRASALTGGAAGFFTHELGGLEADVSGYSGILAVSGGSTSEIDTFAEIDTQIADKSLVNLEDGGTFTANLIANANLSVGNAATTAGVLTILEDDDDGANFASFSVPALAANTVYTLPPDDGDNTEVLQTNGAGVLTWVSNAGGGGDMTKAVYDSGDSGGVDVLTVVDSVGSADYVLLVGNATGQEAPKTDGALTYNAGTGTLAATEFSGGGANLTAVDAATGDAALNFFGAGVTAVTDATACTDIEGTNLAIAAGTLNWTATTRTINLPIMGHGTIPDTTGECYQSNISIEMSLATGLMKNLVMVLKDPSADTGFYGQFKVPDDYTGTPVIAVTGVLDGTVGATSIDFEFSYLTRVDNETIEAGWEESVTFDTGNTNGWTTEDLLEDSASLSANFTAGDTVFYYFKRDQGTDDFVGDFHVVDLYFRYNDG